MKRKFFEKYFKRLEDEISKLEKGLEEIESGVRLNFLVKKLKKSLAKGDLSWVNEKERKVLLDVWNAFQIGLISKEIFERSVNEIAKKMLLEGK